MSRRNNLTGENRRRSMSRESAFSGFEGISAWNIAKQSANCAAKRDYLSRKAARTTSKRLREKYGYLLREYHCPVCGKWHLTSDKEAYFRLYESKVS